MKKQKRTMAVLAIIALLLTFIVPAQAQFYNGPQLPGDDYQSMVDPMGMDPSGMSMPSMFPGMGGMPGMSFMSPFMRGRQSEHVMPITRLPASTGYGKDLMATLESTPQLSLFTAALKATGYDEKLRGPGNYLVFAPSDKAIMRDMAVSDAGALIRDPDLVKGMVENSIVDRPAGQQPNKDKAFTSLTGKKVMLLQARTGISANGADVLNYLGANNGALIVTDGAVGT